LPGCGISSHLIPGYIDWNSPESFVANSNGYALTAELRICLAVLPCYACIVTVLSACRLPRKKMGMEVIVQNYLPPPTLEKQSFHLPVNSVNSSYNQSLLRKTLLFGMN
jgi:hypothetical protein